MFCILLLLQLTLLYAFQASAQSPFQLGYFPLAVKTPYLNTWIKRNKGQEPAGAWPNFVFMNRASELRWVGMICVDDHPYQWMGNSPGFNFTRGIMSEITPTKTVFRLEAGPIQFNVTFFSPIEPMDYVKQSIPFTYMYINGIVANDTLPHTVQVYSDISAQWATKDDNAMVEWNTTVQDNLIYHHVARQAPSYMGENGGLSDDATVYYAMAQRPEVTWRNGGDVATRNVFAVNGNLTNVFDHRIPRRVNDALPVLAFSVDLGTVFPGDHPDPVVWSLGLVRNPSIVYTSNQPISNRGAYYWSNFTNIEEVMAAFLNDFPAALNRSLELDSKVISAAPTPEYADILSLVTRQIFASMDITLPLAQSGKFNHSDVRIFMKDMGRSSRVNPVEAIYGALPALTFFNPSLAHDLLQPLLESQVPPGYPHPYAAPDLGGNYPFASVNSTDTHTLALENCGNMLIMAYGLAVKSGDGAFLSRYYFLLQRWADFLISEDTLHPRVSMTADGADSADMSNLALKGILGIYSMAKITEAVGISNTTHMDHATQLIKDWKNLAIAADGHIQAIYGAGSSWVLMYNLFPALWLGAGLIEDSTLEHQAQLYAQQNFSEFGLGLDSFRPDLAYPHWALMTAATIPASQATVRNRFVNLTRERGLWTDADFPLPALYRPSVGTTLSGSGSPILGAAFAIAAMNIKNLDIQAPQVNLAAAPFKISTVGAVVGAVLGGLASLLLVATIFFLVWRRHRQEQGLLDGTTTKHKETLFSQFRRNNAHRNGALSSDSPRRSSRMPAEKQRSTSPAVNTAATATLHGVSQKRREALGLFRNGETPRQNKPTTAPHPSNITAAAPVLEAEELRAEFEHLRTEIETFRRAAAPPDYTPTPPV